MTSYVKKTGSGGFTGDISKSFKSHAKGKSKNNALARMKEVRSRISKSQSY